MVTRLGYPTRLLRPVPRSLLVLMGVAWSAMRAPGYLRIWLTQPACQRRCRTRGRRRERGRPGTIRVGSLGDHRRAYPKDLTTQACLDQAIEQRNGAVQPELVRQPHPPLPPAADDLAQLDIDLRIDQHSRNAKHLRTTGALPPCCLLRLLPGQDERVEVSGYGSHWSPPSRMGNQRRQLARCI